MALPLCGGMCGNLPYHANPEHPEF